MKRLLEDLYAQKILSREEAKATLRAISEERYNPMQVAAFLSVFRYRGIAVHELMGFRDALLELCIHIDLSDFDTIDLCGTGGDGKDTFNISTVSSFVTAGAGIPVAKHGNYAVSSTCGSSDVMQYLGVEFTGSQDVLKRKLERSGICFLHAPLFHPAMKEVAPIRKALGVKTFFNMLGPMVNPSRPERQLVGVFSNELMRLYQHIYQESTVSYAIVHDQAGYDEVSLTDRVKVLTPIEERILTPNDFGEERIKAESINGAASVAEAAEIFMKILNNAGSAEQKAVVVSNSALAIRCAYPERSVLDCKTMALDSLESGEAKKVFLKHLEA